MSVSDVSATKELIVIFGDERLKREYLKQNDVDPFLVVTAIYPEILGVMQAGETVSIKVVRYPKTRWLYVNAAFSDDIYDTERRLDTYKAKGMTIMEVLV